MCKPECVSYCSSSWASYFFSNYSFFYNRSFLIPRREFAPGIPGMRFWIHSVAAIWASWATTMTHFTFPSKFHLLLFYHLIFQQLYYYIQNLKIDNKKP